jgi:hypothetical protein
MSLVPPLPLTCGIACHLPSPDPEAPSGLLSQPCTAIAAQLVRSGMGNAL